MNSLAAGTLLLAFAIAETVATKSGRRGGALVRGAFAVALAAVSCEFARFDHGHPDWLFSIGFVAAPVLLIFSGAAWGARKWYGWPDLGPLPGRLALSTVGLLVGILVGQQMKVADVVESQERGVVIWQKVKEWRAAHGGEWPARIEDAAPDAPPSRMGLVAPPPFEYHRAKRTLSFPVRTGTDLVLDLAAESPKWSGP